MMSEWCLVDELEFFCTFWREFKWKKNNIYFFNPNLMGHVVM